MNDRCQPGRSAGNMLIIDFLFYADSVEDNSARSLGADATMMLACGWHLKGSNVLMSVSWIPRIERSGSVWFGYLDLTYHWPTAIAAPVCFQLQICFVDHTIFHYLA